MEEGSWYVFPPLQSRVHALTSLPTTVFIIAQFLGGLIGAALVYALYFHAFELFEGAGVRTNATASIFVSQPVSLRLSPCIIHAPYLTSMWLL